jgi:hypothetical protein
MSGFEITCPECHGRGKMEYAEQSPMPEMVRVSAAVTDSETLRKVTKDCETCGGTGRTNSTERIMVLQHGRRVGSVPPSFDPRAIKSGSFFYDVRPGDFIREGDHWKASRTLGPGDLESVPGFVWDRE